LNGGGIISLPFFVNCKFMNIRKKLIGSKVFHKTLNRMILIEKGNEELYERLGMDVFTKRQKPKLQKNDKTSKKRSNDLRNDSNGTDDNIES